MVAAASLPRDLGRRADLDQMINLDLPADVFWVPADQVPETWGRFATQSEAFRFAPPGDLLCHGRTDNC